LIDRVEAAIGKQYFPPYPARVKCFGSFPAGLFLPTADMDLVYTSDQYSNGGNQAIFPSKNQLWKIGRKLEQRGIACELKVIANAKVPIIKFTDNLTGLPVDISFENLSGVEAQSYFQQWRDEFESMVFLVALIKQFLLMRGLNEVNTGGLGGFSIICLVVSYLQLEGQEGNFGDLFLGFLDYYGNKFDLNKTRIVMNPPGREPKVLNDPNIPL
jgi:non-canonical poly(A) RNA polymerase PAPD5/7